MPARRIAALAALALFACRPSSRIPEGAKVLYQVDFSAPEHTVGNPTATVPEGQTQPFPSKVPSQIFFGRPTVVAKLCGLEKQPLQLALVHGAQGMEGVEFLLDQIQSHYRIELDLCIASLDPSPIASQKMQLAVFLDVAEAYALGFMSGGAIGVVDPDAKPETAENPAPVPAQWKAGVPMHLAFDIDGDTQKWQIAIDGKQVYDGPIQMTIPRAVRVVLRGNQRNEAAFDNFVVWGEREVKDLGETEAPVAGPEK